MGVNGHICVCISNFHQCWEEHSSNWMRSLVTGVWNLETPPVFVWTQSCPSHWSQGTHHPAGTQEGHTTYSSCTTAKVGTPAVGILLIMKWNGSRQESMQMPIACFGYCCHVKSQPYECQSTSADAAFVIGQVQALPLYSWATRDSNTTRLLVE